METEKIRYIYCITNLVNGKTYFGQHTLTDGRTFETDTYRGSGKLLWKAYEKYGKGNFKRTCIIQGLFTREQIDRFERCIIRIQRFLGKAEYNIANGGQGLDSEGAKKAHDVWLKEYGQDMYKKMSQCRTEASFEKLRNTLVEFYRTHDNGFKGKHHSYESKKKISDSRKGTLTGKNNGSFGKHWFTNGVENIKCETCPDGFRPGRICK